MGYAQCLMPSHCGNHGIHLLQVVIFASMAMPVVFSAGSISPPADYFVQEGIWVKEHGTQSDAWVTTASLQECLLLSDCQSKLDIAYVIRTANAGENVNATLVFFRNSDTHLRFDGNGTLMEMPVATGCGSAETGGEVLAFWNLTLCMDHGEYHKGYHYFLFLTTFDPRVYSGTYQLRVNVSGLGGGSSWTSPDGNPNCPWIFFEVPSEGRPTIGPYLKGEPLRASSRVNITCANLPAGRSPPKEDYEIFIDYTSFANGTYYGSGFFRNGSQLPRWLQPGWHTLTVVGGEVVASIPFHTSQWDVGVEVSPSATIPNGVPVNITGSGFPINESYTVFLVTPNGTESQILGGAVSKFGNFSTSFRFPKETGLGLHGIRAVSTKVSGLPTAIAYVEIDPWTVNLTVSPTSFHQGGWLDINGSLYPVNSKIEIYLDGETVHQCRTNENGTFHHRMYTLTEEFAPGIHLVAANATDYGGPPCGRAEIRVLGYNASIRIGDAVTNPGRRLNINGSGFPPNELVKIELGPILLGEVVTVNKGIFQAECIIPPEHPLGNHTVRASAPRHGGPPTGTATVGLVQWPRRIEMHPLGPHPGGWIRITGSGLPPGAQYRWSLGGTIISQGTADPAGTFDASPSLPLNLTKGLYILDFVVPGYSGPPSASFSLNITDWVPAFGITPTAPRPGEALWLAGSGFPRGRRYNITVDGIHRGTGKIDQDGDIAAYLFLRRNVSLGAHCLNVSIDFSGIASMPIELQIVPWTPGLNLSPLWGEPGSTVELHAFGFPPSSSLEIAWGDLVLASVQADLSGAHTE